MEIAAEDAAKIAALERGVATGAGGQKGKGASAKAIPPFFSSLSLLVLAFVSPSPPLLSSLCLFWRSVTKSPLPPTQIMSWWDYGYQITAMADRTVIVDNNTWNNTHISRVGQAMASDEQHAYEIMRELDVDYVLGGLPN